MGRQIRGQGQSVNADAMTVGELVALLLKMPQDVVVLYRACSDWTVLRPDDIKLTKAEEQLVIYRPQNGYSEYYAPWFPKDGEKPDFRTAVLFPGN